jgi:predicted phosphodiesterase
MRAPALALSLAVAVAGCAADDSGPCRGPVPDKGPWVMRADGQGATVFWETTTQGCVAIGVTPEAGGEETQFTGVATETTVQSSYGEDLGLPMPDLAGTYYVNHADATALAPGTCYRYRLRDTDGGERSGRFCTARTPDQPYTFLAIGDTNPILGHTLPVLDHTLPSNPDFTVHMGDLQYYSSIRETWAYWFDAMAPMLEVGALFPAVGNHENELGGTEFTDYYDRLFHQPSNDGTPDWYRFEWGGVWFHTIDTEVPYDSASPQFQWLAASLAEVTAKPGFRLSVVWMHRPLYTLGDTTPNVDLRNALAPLFEANKVRLVLQGHMHGYERFEVGDITYVTTAGGGGTIADPSANVANYPMDAPYRVAVAAKYHAMLWDVTPMGAATQIHGRAIDETGAVIDEVTHAIP